MNEEILLEKIKNLKEINKQVPELIRKINALEFPLNLNSLNKGNRKNYDINEALRNEILKDLRSELSKIRGE